jgi:outer membrane protein OmpA-like peptidoglycan-associated protein
MLAGLMFLSGCATRGFVRREVGTATAALEPKITEVSTANRENAERIDAVDQRAQQGIQGASQQATQANTAAQAAQTTATTADRKADTANQGVQTANNRINTIETRIGSLDNYTAGQPEAVMFPVNSSALSMEAMTTLDTVANQVSGQRSGYLVEIQGFTDTTGDETYNVTLSQRRAEAVLRYLVSKNVPLHRISIVGLGESNPRGDNTTRAGREQNRRVEVRILRSAGTAATN